MKRTERHHLKDNELAHLTASARDVLESQGRGLVIAIAAVVVVIVAVGGYVSWRGRVESRAHAALASALAVEEARVGPPAAFGTQQPTGVNFVSQREKYQAVLTKYQEVADQYP